uniref:Uncharacterized protein n=1 Tax=Candidatus Methanophaga sp. ANME-1 ERB7 TaxID=2759913 RepID=A0A7G9ZBD8_9EURY|nr:hypothetical protein KFNHKPCL_00020 [Methanosarcinales archaeon ANME-1 ERB7]
MVSLLTYHGEPVEAYGKMNGVKSLYTGSVLNWRDIRSKFGYNTLYEIPNPDKNGKI